MTSICIGRVAAAGDSGIIDNLYMSTGGYPVIVETKLWRNPQSRREVLSQVLDYTKEVARKDFDWLEEQWRNFSKERQPDYISLLDIVSEIAAEELDEHEFIDRVNRALDRGDIISLIVGDGIESRLQSLVSHLCKDSAHLRYSLALIELACYQMKGDQELLVVPRIIREVEPIQRAYVKIDVAEGLDKQISVQPLVDDKPSDQIKKRRTTLTEEDFLNGLDEHLGQPLRKKVEAFYNDLIETYGIEPIFTSANLLIKFPDPLGENPSVTLIALEKMGRIYNARGVVSQLPKLLQSEERAEQIYKEYWRELHSINPGFNLDGIRLQDKRLYLPIDEIHGDFDKIKQAIGNIISSIQQELDSEQI